MTSDPHVLLPLFILLVHVFSGISKAILFGIYMTKQQYLRQVLTESRWLREYPHHFLLGWMINTR